MIFGGISKKGKTNLWIKPSNMSIDADTYEEILE